MQPAADLPDLQPVSYAPFICLRTILSVLFFVLRIHLCALHNGESQNVRYAYVVPDTLKSRCLHCFSPLYYS